MHAAGSRETYALDSKGRQFLDDSKRLVDRELDHYGDHYGQSRPPT